MTDIDTGLNVWQMTSNHNRMIDLQADTSPPRDGPVEVAFFGSSAFRITSPRGVSVMIDPWRNHPSRTWDWYFHDFPITAVDIGGLWSVVWWLLQGARPTTSYKLFLSPRSIVKFARFSILTLLILIAGSAGLSAGATQPVRLDGFQLLDQNGAPAGIAPSKQATLVYFYRGDW